MKRNGMGIGGLAAAILILGAGAAAQQPGPRPQPADQTRATYLLGPDDVVTIRALNVPDISEKPVRLDSNGEIKLPMVGRMQAGGLTVEKLESEIVKRLKVYLEEPEVAVSITEFRSQPVSVVGAVTSPGVHQLEGQKTLVEILAVAGGVRPDAGPNVTITRRLEYGRIPAPGAKDDSTGQFSVAEINLRSVTEAKNPEYNILIRPHDVLSIPRAEAIYVIGEVAKAGPLTLNEGQSISVLEAVSSSGGMLRTAAANHARILRPIAGQPRRSELDVDVKKIMAGKSDDVPLLAGDILVVPGSGGKRAAIRVLDAAIQAGTIAASYGALH